MPYYSARVEYALHTLLNLSLAPSATAPSARELAEFQKLPVAFMRRLLTQLEKAGLVAGSEGVTGGWRLARRPDRITVLDIVDGAHGPDTLFECREIRARCALWPDDNPPRGATTGVCAIHAVMLGAEAAMRRELAAHTLADIAACVRAKTSEAGAAAILEWFASRYATRDAGRRAAASKSDRR